MSDRQQSDRHFSWPSGPGVNVAAGGIVLWVLLEFAFRRGLAPALAGPLDTATGADMLSVAVAFTLLAVIIGRLGRRTGIDRTESIGTISRKAVGAGLAGVVGYVLLYGSAVIVASALFELNPSAGMATTNTGDTPTWAPILLLAVNGVLVPITEEIAWRGVIQTALTDAYGSAIAIVLTAAAFVLKHLIVDLAVSPFRTTSLVILAVILCGLRARYGTTSSIVTHLVVNSLATVPFALALL